MQIVKYLGAGVVWIGLCSGTLADTSGLWTPSSGVPTQGGYHSGIQLAQATVDQTTPAPVQYVTWTDPTERAFTVSVPRDWTIAGGLSYTGSLEPHLTVIATSPDGHIRAFINDPDILPLESPTQRPRCSDLPKARYRTISAGPSGSPVTCRGPTTPRRT